MNNNDNERTNTQGEYTWNGASYSGSYSQPRQEQQSSGAAPYAQYVPYSAPQPKKKASFLDRRITLSVKAIAAALAVVIAGSALFGFGGGYLAVKTASDSGAAPGSTVLYEAVEHTSASGDSEFSVAGVAAKAADSVVEITTESAVFDKWYGQYVSEGAGSGVVITEDGYIATNNHVIQDASKITVTTRSGESYSARLVATDEKTDIAVIKVEESGFKPAVFGKSSALVVGEPAIAIGNPLGELGGTVTSGIISALGREITIDGESMTLLQTSASINPGNSGGGLFNAEGELIGIVNAKSAGDNIEGLGFAIPSDTAKRVVEQLITFGYVQGRISLGMSLVDITDRTSAMMYRVNYYGVYILSLREGSNAQRAGFRSGDLIVSVGETQVNSSAEVSEEIKKYSVGDSVEIKLIRDGREKTIALVLEEFKGEGR